MVDQSRSTPQREYSAHSDDVDAAVAKLMGTDKDRLEKLLDLAEQAYTDAYCGIESKALKAMRDYCEPGMVMRLFSMVESGQLQRLSVERELCVPSETAAIVQVLPLAPQPPTVTTTTAHSKTEYKRLKEQGANVLPPHDTDNDGQFGGAAYDLRSLSTPSAETTITPMAWHVVNKNGVPVRWLHPQYTDPATFADPSHDLCIADANEEAGFPHRWEALYRTPAVVPSARTSITPDFIMGQMENDLAQALHGLPEIWRAGFKARFEGLMRKVIALSDRNNDRG